FKKKSLSLFLAETKGFEPLRQVLPVCSLSRGVPSTSRPRLHQEGAIIASSRLPVKQDEPNLSSRRFEAERLVQRAHGELEVLVLDGHRDLYFGGRNHLDVDAFFSQRAEHLRGNTRVRAHADADD